MSNAATVVEPDQPKVMLPLGRIVATRGALEAVEPLRIAQCIARHAAGDWGCVCEADRQANDAAVKEGDRILSAYPIDPSRPSRGHGENTLWIITEWDRSVTTALLPEEY
jgi:hypothetical protein